MAGFFCVVFFGGVGWGVRGMMNTAKMEGWETLVATFFFLIQKYLEQWVPSPFPKSVFFLVHIHLLFIYPRTFFLNPHFKKRHAMTLNMVPNILLLCFIHILAKRNGGHTIQLEKLSHSSHEKTWNIFDNPIFYF